MEKKVKRVWSRKEKTKAGEKLSLGFEGEREVYGGQKGSLRRATVSNASGSSAVERAEEGQGREEEHKGILAYVHILIHPFRCVY